MQHRVLPLCALLGLLFIGFPKNLQAQEALAVGPRDIIFLLDTTMGNTLLTSIREFIRHFVNAMPIGPSRVQIGVAQFGTSAWTEFDLNTHGSQEAISAALGGLRPRPGQTVNIGAALDHVRTNMLRPDRGSRRVPQLVLLMTTKRSSDSVDEAARALQQMGVLTLAAGSKGANEEELKRIAFTDSMVFMLRDFRTLLRNPRAIVDAFLSLSGTAVTEAPAETVVETLRDIVFLVDGSSYISPTNFPYVRNFIINIVNRLDVRPDRVQIGLLQFAEYPMIEFYLNSYSSREEVVHKINHLSRLGGSVLNTGKALDYALKNMFRPAAGSRRRQGVQQVLVLITGGPTQDQVKSVADQLALAGVLTFTVSSGQAVANMLRSVAFVPDLAYHVTDFSHLPALSQKMLPKLTVVIGDTDTVTTFPEAARDVVFLIDGSDSVRGDFAYIQDFIIRVIQPLDIAADKVRVAVVQHSEQPNPSFYLNTYQTKDDVVRAINNMRVAGGRSLNTGAALKFMKDTVLTERQGSRAMYNVSQFLIVLSGSRSGDSVRDSADALRTDGVVLFGVGVKDVDLTQIEIISHNPSFAFKVRDFSELNTVPGRLNNYVSLPREELQVVLQQGLADGPRDIIFLLDTTMGNTQLTATREFIRRFVNTTPIRPSRVQIGVAQFGTSAQTEFDLNTHGSREAISAALGGLRPRPGQTVNIGAALDHVRTNMLRPDRGSRRVPQLVLLMTTKRSSDSVDEAARALQQMGVLTLAAGSKGANEEELKRIAFSDSVVFMLKDFRTLLRNPISIMDALTSLSGTAVSEGSTETSTALVQPFPNSTVSGPLHETKHTTERIPTIQDM